MAIFKASLIFSSFSLVRGTGLQHEFTGKNGRAEVNVPGTWAGECEKKMGLNNKAEIELTIF
jgi:hypothetical protein